MSPFALFYHQPTVLSYSLISFFPYPYTAAFLLWQFILHSFTSIHPWWDYESLLVLYFIFPFVPLLSLMFSLPLFLPSLSSFSSDHSSLSSWSDLWIILNLLLPFPHPFIPPKVPHSILHNCFPPQYISTYHRLNMDTILAQFHISILLLFFFSSLDLNITFWLKMVS